MYPKSISGQCPKVVTCVISNCFSDTDSQVLGFGLMNAEGMVTQAASWTNVPTQQTCTTATFTGSG